jgi:hypothetical protein
MRWPQAPASTPLRLTFTLPQRQREMRTRNSRKRPRRGESPPPPHPQKKNKRPPQPRPRRKRQALAEASARVERDFLPSVKELIARVLATGGCSPPPWAPEPVACDADEEHQHQARREPAATTLPVPAPAAAVVAGQARAKEPEPEGEPEGRRHDFTEQLRRAREGHAKVVEELAAKMLKGTAASWVDQVAKAIPRSKELEVQLQQLLVPAAGDLSRVAALCAALIDRFNRETLEHHRCQLVFKVERVGFEDSIQQLRERVLVLTADNELLTRKLAAATEGGGGAAAAAAGVAGRGVNPPSRDFSLRGVSRVHGPARARTLQHQIEQLDCDVGKEKAKAARLTKELRAATSRLGALREAIHGTLSNHVWACCGGKGARAGSAWLDTLGHLHRVRLMTDLLLRRRSESPPLQPSSPPTATPLQPPSQPGPAATWLLLLRRGDTTTPSPLSVAKSVMAAWSTTQDRVVSHEEAMLAGVADCVRLAALNGPLGKDAATERVKDVMEGLGLSQQHRRLVCALVRVRGYSWGRCLPCFDLLSRDETMGASSGFLGWLVERTRSKYFDGEHVPDNVRLSITTLLKAASDDGETRVRRYANEIDLSSKELLNLPIQALRDRAFDEDWTPAMLKLSSAGAVKVTLQLLPMRGCSPNWWTDVMADTSIQELLVQFPTFGCLLRAQRSHLAGKRGVATAHDVQISRQGKVNITKHVVVFTEGKKGGSRRGDVQDLAELCREQVARGGAPRAPPLAQFSLDPQAWLLGCHFCPKTLRSLTRSRKRSGVAR